ncbi:FadR/GntR family transcriptional regulator [Paraconexibacter sp.]|uniref:FadR/GntR family transcriptional regulator n=1 Tax=Paraconexibacter sp. TaxID=2949640 RepID=UPI00356B382C
MAGTTSTASQSPGTVSEQVFSALRADILGGTLAPGDALAGERPLAERLGCNRHAIREAVKRLQQAGLVEVAQGGATRVLDWRATGGLDLLTQLAGAGVDGTVDPQLGASVLPGVLEMRACIGADVAGRCAERAPDALLAELPGLLDAVRDARPEDLGAREDRYAELWARVVVGSDNLAYRLAFNSLVSGVNALGPVALSLLADELADDDGHRTLVDALLRRDAPAAELAARALLTTVR